MRVERVGFELDQRDSDVGAVVGDALVVGQKIVEDEALAERAQALLQAVDVVELQFVAKVVDQLLERLNAGRQLQIVIDEGTDGRGQDLRQRSLHDLELMRSRVREGEILLVQLLRALGNVQRVVGNSFKVGERVQEFGDLSVLPDRHLPFRHLDKIRAELILIAVDGFFQILDQLIALVGEAVQQGHGLDKVPLGLFGHGVDGQAALLDGQRGVLDEALFEPDSFRLDRLLLRLVRDKKVDDLLDLARERQQRDDLDEAEDRVDKGDRDARHDAVRKREADERVKTVVDRGKEDHARDLSDQIDHGRALAVDRSADGGEQDRHGRADGDAHDDRQRDGKINDARRGQRLQDADGCGGRLQHAGEKRTEKDAEEGIGEGGQDADKGRILAQRRHGRGHRGHAEHQDREAHQDIADVLLGGVFARHAQHDTDHGDHARKRRRRKQVHPAAGRADVRKTDDPARDGRTENSAEDDGDRLPHLHHPGVDKADHHDRRRRGRLDHGRHARAEQEALDRAAGQPV